MRLYLLRHVWRNLLAMLQSRPDLPHNSLVNNWLITCYGETMGVGIRRQAQVTGDRATIGSLLRRVGEDASSFTRSFCAIDDEQLPGRSDIWLRYAATLEEPLEPARITPISLELLEAEKATRHWVNNRIAHLDPSASEVRATFGDLERGLAGLRQGLMFLYPLFTRGSVLWQVTPHTDYLMFEMFKEPWYVPDAMQPVEASDDPLGP